MSKGAHSEQIEDAWTQQGYRLAGTDCNSARTCDMAASTTCMHPCCWGLALVAGPGAP